MIPLRKHEGIFNDYGQITLSRLSAVSRNKDICLFYVEASSCSFSFILSFDFSSKQQLVRWSHGFVMGFVLVESLFCVCS